MGELERGLQAALHNVQRSRKHRFAERRVALRIDAEHYFKLMKVAMQLDKSATSGAEFLLGLAIEDAWKQCGLGEIDDDEMDRMLAGPPSAEEGFGTKSEPTKTSRILTLHAAGRTTSEIAAEVGISYQHAYNTLKQKGLINPRGDQDGQ